VTGIYCLEGDLNPERGEGVKRGASGTPQPELASLRSK